MHEDTDTDHLTELDIDDLDLDHCILVVVRPCQQCGTAVACLWDEDMAVHGPRTCVEHQ